MGDDFIGMVETKVISCSIYPDDNYTNPKPDNVCIQEAWMSLNDIQCVTVDENDVTKSKLNPQAVCILIRQKMTPYSVKVSDSHGYSNKSINMVIDDTTGGYLYSDTVNVKMFTSQEKYI